MKKENYEQRKKRLRIKSALRYLNKYCTYGGERYEKDDLQVKALARLIKLHKG